MTTHALDNPAFASEDQVKASLQFLGVEDVDAAYNEGGYSGGVGAGVAHVVGAGPEVEAFDPGAVTPVHDGTHPDEDGNLDLREEAQAKHDAPKPAKKAATKRPVDELFSGSKG